MITLYQDYVEVRLDLTTEEKFQKFLRTLKDGYFNLYQVADKISVHHAKGTCGVLEVTAISETRVKEIIGAIQRMDKEIHDALRMARLAEVFGPKEERDTDASPF